MCLEGGVWAVPSCLTLGNLIITWDRETLAEKGSHDLDYSIHCFVFTVIIIDVTIMCSLIQKMRFFYYVLNDVPYAISTLKS